MVILPSPTQVARNHTLIYEAFYQQVDPAGKGCVVAADAAAFLKQSGLPDSVLSRIWDLSDPLGNGFLDKQGFFVALKLIALSQNGKDVGMANICEEVPPPQMQACTGRSSPAIDWSVKPSEYKKYEEMFNSLGPVGDRLPGHKVKPVMLNSKLPLDVLGKIWDLSDTDQDGFLTKGEFVLAMHLIYKALENIPVPVILPPELTAVVNKRNSIPGFTQVLPDSLISTVDNVVVTNSIRRSSTPSGDVLNKTTWVVNALDKAKYDKLFYTLDADADGFVTGADVRETLLHSGLSQSVLAHIWNLCDIKQNGKLNSEQFALAMYFVHQGLQGNEIPAALFPEMIPPTLRPKPPPDNQQESPLAMTGDHESSGSKELDLISNEIKELHTGKMSLEKDIAQKEADVKIKNGELKNLQNELEALETMLKQLEIQKGEARKRLNDLDKQKGSVDLMLCDVSSRMEDETNQVEALKKQREEQTTNLKSQEHELVSKRQELNDMQQEEIKLETQINNGRQQLDALNSTLQSTQLQISQIKLKIDQMQEQNRLITDAIQQLDYALSNEDFKNISEFTFSAIAPINGAELNGFSPSIDIPLKSENGVKVTTPITDFEEDPFKSKDPFNDKTNGFVNDPFAGEDPFKSDPFKEGITTDDPFASDPFQEVFGVTQSDSKEDPFQGSDPFGSFGVTTSSAPKNDPFDPFGLSSNQPVQPVVVSGELVADPFGADPFGPGPVAPPRPESPTPALPPKKSKAPPPRPAPPKVASAPPIKSGPTRAAPAPPVPTAVDPFKIIETETTDSVQPFPDLFAQPTGNAFDPFISTDGVQADFANFADFDSVK